MEFERFESLCGVRNEFSNPKTSTERSAPAFEGSKATLDG